jgi:hypothetical protein
MFYRKVPKFSAPERIDDFLDVTAHDIPKLPGMIKEAEGRYLYWLTSRRYTGKGAVVEIGSWLGRSTTYLASGLRINNVGAKLHCFDHFKWSKNWYYTTHINMPDKTDFLPMFLNNIVSYRDIIEVHRTTMRDLSWVGEPVEILFLDAPKRLSDISSVLTAFAKCLIPGVSIIVWQDFRHCPSFEIPASMSSLYRYVRPLHVVTSGCTVSFRVSRVFPKRKVSEKALSFRHWSENFAKRVWEAWQVVVPEERRGLFKFGLAMLLHDIGEFKSAQEITKSLAQDSFLGAKMSIWKNTNLFDRYRMLFEAFGAIRSS